MKYKLISPPNKKYSTIEQILINRGIKQSDIHHYLNLTDNDINNYLLLGEEALKKAVAALVKTIKNNEDAFLIIDSDCDGLTSAALLVNYLYLLFPTWVANHLIWEMHSGKQHGLKDCIDKI